ncbi:hypothetical protein [Tautonia rosea]|uniref:hypothetical protein n=1 Tax=Tautonia rosea TaxID=2728037 RepID=UPI001473D726|nr:hypothetical protein [Tautonia rosea]
MTLEPWPTRSIWLWAVLTVGFVGLFLARFPTVSTFDNFLFADWGANLTVQALLDRGEQPIVDYFYPYGLLPLLLGRFGFGLFEKTPQTYLGFMVLSHVFAAWGMARLASALRVGVPGVVFLIVTIPYALPSTHPSLSHALETVLICHALAEQARGRRHIALALATAAVLTKPSMAYVLGLVLLGFIARELIGRTSDRLREGWSQIRPAFLTALGFGVVLAVVFGIRPLIGSILPLQVASLYRDADYGFFFGTGRRFWLPDNAGVRHYLGTQLGFWLASTVALIAGGLRVLALAIRREGRDARNESLSHGHVREIVLTCAILHMSFLCFFFAGEVSWLYYSYLLILGITALGGLGAPWPLVVAILATLALVADRSIPGEVVAAWDGGSFSADSRGLWTSPEQQAEWQEVLRRVEGHPTAVLSMAGAAPVLYPDHFLPSVTLFLLPGMEGTIDTHRMARHIQSAELVLVPTRSAQGMGVYPFLLGCPELRLALNAKDPIWKGSSYAIYRTGEDESRDKDFSPGSICRKDDFESLDRPEHPSAPSVTP